MSLFTDVEMHLFIPSLTKMLLILTSNSLSQRQLLSLEKIVASNKEKREFSWSQCSLDKDECSVPNREMNWFDILGADKHDLILLMIASSEEMLLLIISRICRMMFSPHSKFSSCDIDDAVCIA